MAVPTSHTNNTTYRGGGREKEREVHDTPSSVLRKKKIAPHEYNQHIWAYPKSLVGAYISQSAVCIPFLHLAHHIGLQLQRPGGKA